MSTTHTVTSSGDTAAARVALPEPTLRRLPLYLSLVSLLAEQGVDYVSSTAIARRLHVDSSQIAKDLSFLSIKGKTRIGYEVRELEHELEDFLGFKRGHNAVIVGVGSLGKALIGDSGLGRYGLNIVAGFDTSADVIGTSLDNVPVYDISELSERRPLYRAEIGIIAVPAQAAQETADALVASGVRALWNFTPYRVVPPEGIVIQNTSIYAHLAVMYNRMSLFDDATHPAASEKGDTRR